VEEIMSLTEFHLFKRNTEAIATNRGFYYQYLITLKLWLDNFLNSVDNEIYCEREDDIFEFTSKSKKCNFHQVKCYAEGFGLNSPEIKSSLMNFYNLYNEHKDTKKLLFHFVTNAYFRPKAGKSLKRWFEKQNKGNFSSKEFEDEVRTLLIKFVEWKLIKYKKRVTDSDKLEKAEKDTAKFKIQICKPDFLEFLDSIRWQFSGEIDTGKAISTLKKEIELYIESDKLDFDHSIDCNIIFGYLLNTVIDKSIESDETKRLLNRELLLKIITSTDMESEIRKRLRPEVISLMLSNFEIIDILETMDKKLTDTQVKVDKIVKSICNNDKATLITNLTNEVKNWFKALGYGFEKHEIFLEDSSELIININNRRGYDRILVLCISDVIEYNHLLKLKEKVETCECDEGWIVASLRISNSVRSKNRKGEFANLFCYTIDELIDESTDFAGYFEWLEKEVKSKEIDKKYISLNCKKDVFNEDKSAIIDSSEYKIEDYIDQWLDDPVKKHVSILGEFGTGKTWFTLHYAWKRLKKYKVAKTKGLNRPRIPIFIPLRDFTKAVNVEGVFSEFFFRKHNSPIPTYNAFEELNKMGKLLFIFDGFDEMADKVDNQKMINNFWELARAISNNSKVVLTCRNEHFPEAKHGRRLLNAELKASTQNLIAEAPQFEVLDLLKLNERQIEKLLKLYTDKKTVSKIMKIEELLDLASRPIMIGLIIDGLAEIKEGKPIDLSRIYLYAIKNKLKKDMKENRTFTSISDKLFFMCELSWEMILTENMSINYRLFPDRIRELFSESVQEEKDIDHWQYDMMGQTLLVRNDDGDYKPAHRSLLEFFIAYKFASELGVLDDDFTAFAYGIGNYKDELKAKVYYWHEYFSKSKDVKLLSFTRIPLSELKETFGRKVITRAVLDLMKNMISFSSRKTQETLNQIIEECRSKCFDQVKYTVTNLIILIVFFQNDYFAGKDLSDLEIPNFVMPFNNTEKRIYSETDFANFRNTNFSNSNLSSGQFFTPSLFFGRVKNPFLRANFTNANLTKFTFNTLQINSIDYLHSKDILAIGSPDCVTIINHNDFSILKRIECPGWDVLFSPDGKFLAHSGYGYLCLRNTENFEIVINHKLSKQFNPLAQEDGKNLWTGGFCFNNDSKIIYVACNNAFVYAFDIENEMEIDVFECFEGADNVSLSYDEKYLVCNEFNAFSLWELQERRKIKYDQTLMTNLNMYKSKFHPQQNMLVQLDKNRIRIYDVSAEECVFENDLSEIEDFCFSADGKNIYVASENSLHIINIESKAITDSYTIKLPTPLFHKYDSLETVFLIEGRENEICYLTLNQVVIMNFVNNEVVDIIVLMQDLTGIKFKDTKGINKDLAEIIKKNGGII
jgi:WD40 repeat protein